MNGISDASTSTSTSTFPDLALVLLHPHAALGGSMADPVCSAIYREAKKHPRFGAVARYNARGVTGGIGRGRLLLSSLWRSRQGSDDAAEVVRAVATGEGIDIDGETSFGDEDEEEEEEEEEDEGEEEGEGSGARNGGSRSSSSSAAAKATAATLPSQRRSHGQRRRRRRKGYPPISRTFVVGYSWGSCVGAAAVSNLIPASAKKEEEEKEGKEERSEGKEQEQEQEVEIGGFVAVSPPLGTAASLALGSSKCFSLLSTVPDLPVLVKLGDSDLFCSERAAKSSVEGVDRARRKLEAAKPAALSLEISPGLDHFWGAEDDPWSREEIGKLARRIVAWILEQ